MKLQQHLEEFMPDLVKQTAHYYDSLKETFGEEKANEFLQGCFLKKLDDYLSENTELLFDDLYEDMKVQERVEKFIEDGNVNPILKSVIELLVKGIR